MDIDCVVSATVEMNCKMFCTKKDVFRIQVIKTVSGTLQYLNAFFISRLESCLWETKT